MTKHVTASSTTLKFLATAAMAVAVTCSVGLASAVRAAEVRHQDGEHFNPTGKGFGEHDPSGETARRAAAFATTSTNGINYHGGPVMLNKVNLYYIWYGAWNFTNDTTKTLLTTFGSYIGGTPYFNINTTYYNASNQAVSGQVGFVNSITDTGSQGTTLSDNAVQRVVAAALSSKALPTDPNGVYFVLTSKEIKESSGFCTQYCAWHTHGSINGQDIKYGFVGNPLQCPSACSAQTVSPNSNVGADGMANLIAHELSESVTDPDLNAWFDTKGNENADKCAWTFGTTTKLTSGALYNVTFGSLHWLIQQIWENAAGGSCKLAK